ncbi:probable receptor-like protein kinase At2g23200 [Abrus precatorius]|uniref:Probable receptor-like protein kinase At2g23200 n=1 Tax=Abrus precatorius TaxID=3816 RepID=A0A8B8KPT9_ABRPR|nr:probable receptor-like protein kinase At2g23200 [Abrus precatorius]
MAILQLHTTQHTLFTVLVFLLQFSSSLGYKFPDKYFINCGSSSDVTESGKGYVGESNPDYPATHFTNSKTESSESSVSSPLYQTARIFKNESWYEFSTETNGTYLLRLHFFAFSSSSNLSSARFNVSIPRFWLLKNFDASNGTNNSVLIKEFFMKSTASSIRITFRPLSSSFAFVNAIELFVLPLLLIANDVTGFNYNRRPLGLNYYSGLLTRVLETRHRLNVGGQPVARDHDNLLRNWITDDRYLTNPANAKNSTPYEGQIQYHVSDDSDGPNSGKFTAPSDVYGTAKEINNNTNLSNITWSLPVEKNTDHLLRLHFCDFWNQQAFLTIFNMFIYDSYFMQVNNDTIVSSQVPAPCYYDFVVTSDESGFMNISVAPIIANVSKPNAFLNGLEIMKVIESSDSVPMDLEQSNHNNLPLVLGSILGGLVMIFVVMVLLFLWPVKIRRQKRVENSNPLSILVTAGGSSHAINIRLKLPLLDLRLATNNFDANQIIGTGGFGSVYMGVLKNGLRVAVKRSESGYSGQGLSEFQTEIIVLSKIRHKHLVSLIGYCDERGEMILVYEFMEKGTLRDHLYNTNLPSLSWKQRLEICIGAARGLHYLHKGVAGGIIHRDVKSTNILLDENYEAKVADFGISRTGPVNLEPYVSTDVKGTFGYLDPEYFRLQKLTEKSDVYSFGVVLLEVLCARPAIDPSLPRELVNLAEWGLFCKNKGILDHIIDPSIKGQIDQNSLRKFSETVEKCLQEDGSDRPTMGEVLWDLEYALQLQRGANAIQREPHEDSSSSASASLQLPNVRCLPSLSTLSEVDGSSIVWGEEFDGAAISNEKS